MMPPTPATSSTPESIRDSWRTPGYLLDWIRSFDVITGDAAASDEWHVAPVYRTAQDSALDDRDWLDLANNGAGLVFCNPPYSSGMKARFFEKAIEQKALGVRSVFLVPALPAERWFQRAAAAADLVQFIAGRVAFVHPETGREVAGVPAGSALVWLDWTTLNSSRVEWIDRDEIRAGAVAKPEPKAKQRIKVIA